MSPTLTCDFAKGLPGVVKNTDLTAFSNPRAGGIIAMGVEDEDRLITAQITDGTGEVFIGTRDAYQSYRAILTQPTQPDDVSADYKTQVSALLEGDPVDMLGNPPYAAEYFRNYY